MPLRSSQQSWHWALAPEVPVGSRSHHQAAATAGEDAYQHHHTPLACMRSKCAQRVRVCVCACVFVRVCV